MSDSFETHVKAFNVMSESTYGDEIDSAFSIRPDSCKCYSAGRLCLARAGNIFYCGQGILYTEIVKHNTVHQTH